MSESKMRDDPRIEPAVDPVVEDQLTEPAAITQHRYFVDERRGAVAVRNREHTDPSRPGLQPSTGGVVRFWSGVQSKETCPTCGHEQWDKWVVADADIDAAHAMCDQLNKSNASGLFERTE